MVSHLDRVTPYSMPQMNSEPSKPKDVSKDVPKDPSLDSKEKDKEKDSNSNPPFKLPSKDHPKMGIIPPGLMHQAQAMRAKKGDQEAYLNGEQSEKLSKEMRQKRKEAYFPPKKE